MKIDFTGLSYDPKWYEFSQEPGFKPEPMDEPHPDKPCLKIRPYPSEKRGVIFREDGIYSSGEDAKEIYNHCFVDMSGFVDANDQPLAFSDAVKENIAKFELAGIPGFVCRQSSRFDDAKKAEEKNSQTGPAGTSAKTE